MKGPQTLYDADVGYPLCSPGEAGFNGRSKKRLDSFHTKRFLLFYHGNLG